jgi:hypothetical protein
MPNVRLVFQGTRAARNIDCPTAPAMNDPDGISGADIGGVPFDFKRSGLKYVEIDQPAVSPVPQGSPITLHYTNGISESYGVINPPNDRAPWVQLVPPVGPIRYYNGDLVEGIEFR